MTASTDIAYVGILYTQIQMLKVKVHLITEDLDLAVGSVQGFVTAVVVAVGVYLYHQRKTLHPLLRGEICAQTVHCDEDLTIREEDKKMYFCKISVSLPLY